MSLLCRICCKKIQLLQCRQLSTKTLNQWKSPIWTFQKLLDKRPLLTNTIIGGLFMFAGDLTQQLYFNPVIKWKEVAAFTSIGIMFGPAGAVWYRYLDIWFPGTAAFQIVKKLILDELAWGPLFVGTVFYVLPFVETLSHEKAVSELKNKFLNAWIGSAGFWLFFQSINFKFLPTKYRMTYLFAVSFVYDTALAVYKYQY